jgi:putative ABC transport system permease protein
MNAAKAAIPGVVTVAGTRGMQSSVLAGSVERTVNLVGVTEGFQQIRNLLILRGRFIDADDIHARSRVCLITTQLANLVFPFADPVGRNLRVGEFSYTVIGVFKERVETFGLSEIQDYSVLIPFPLMKYYTGDTSLEMLYAQAGTPEGVVPVTGQLEALLHGRHPTRARYQVMNLSSILDAARKIALALTIVLVLIGFIALLVSGIGIMNIMLVTVRERTREIGIRKAIGARRGEILTQFLLEAFLISGFGSVLGILIAVASSSSRCSRGICACRSLGSRSCWRFWFPVRLAFSSGICLRIEPQNCSQPNRCDTNSWPHRYSMVGKRECGHE